jgi:hypothetical protein
MGGINSFYLAKGRKQRWAVVKKRGETLVSVKDWSAEQLLGYLGSKCTVELVVSFKVQTVNALLPFIIRVQFRDVDNGTFLFHDYTFLFISIREYSMCILIEINPNIDFFPIKIKNNYS